MECLLKMRYSEEIRQELLAKNNIVDVIGEVVSLKRSGSDYLGLCPFHHEKTPSFSVSERKQVYYCFGCHAGGNVITFLMDYYKYSFTEALRYLADRAGMTLPEEAVSPEEKAASEKKQNLLAVYRQAAAFYYYRLTAERDRPCRGLLYLKERGLDEKTIRHFGLGYADQYGDSLYRYLKRQSYPDDLLRETGLFYFDEKKGPGDRFWNRVMFPITDIRGRVIGFGGRVMGDGKPKYLNSPESFLFNKRKNLYALHYARSTRRPYLILCEGYMDVITLHQAGFTNACASLGTALTEEQASLLGRYTSEVCLIYDSDEAGRTAALRAIPILRKAGLGVRVADLSPYKDPDECIRSEGSAAMEERIARADNAFLFELVREAASVKRDDPAAWTKFQRTCASRLMQFTDELERENYLEAVCARFSIQKDGMRKLVRSAARYGTPAETYRPPRSGIEKTKPSDGELAAEKLLLYWLAAKPSVYDEVSGLISPEDFQDRVCRKAAEILFSQLETGQVSEAGILAGFSDAEEQKAVAEIFLNTGPLLPDEEADRAFTDAVIRLIRSGSQADLLSAQGGGDAVTRFIKRKRILEEFRAGRILHLR